MSSSNYFRSWIDRPHLDPNTRLLTEEYQRGITEFMGLVHRQPEAKTGMLRCPCSNCKNRKVIKEWDVWTHLYLSGFTRSYKIWYHHGETDYEHGSTSEPQPAVRLEEPIRTDVDYGVGTEQMSVPKKKGRLVGLGRRTRSVPPSSAPPPFVDPEVLTAQLKDKDDHISLLETQMAAQQADYEAQRRLNQQMMEMMQRMYPNEDSFLGIFRGLISSEIPDDNSEEHFVGTSEDCAIGKSIEISRGSSPSVYSEEISDGLLVLGVSLEICFLGIPSEISEEIPRKNEFPRSYIRGLISSPIVGEGKKKKKQGKDEADRIKQAEKKKRRLEKNLAASLAIRAELEKKKQRIKEGHQEAADEESWAKKKRQEKDELERVKRAEKKKIRLEKSLANSAAIRAALEKKKLKKLEEQRRLDEEGAAIAEAAALHVLLGEDSDDSCRTMLNQETGFKPWDCTAKLNLSTSGRNGFFPHQAVHRSRVSDCNWSVSYEPSARGWDNSNMGLSADLIAAQAVSSLQISENAIVDAVVFNGMFRR
ncbi:hypothetical protein F2Q68_00008237 [Brassica cretica]|uniref:Transposase-associated domain-containing protein n=1 Tax=Brassica cretica TaxID=69181 RepID=A0A8S9KUM0_BRACR|nr:hypothetical protein F2Q68_00008237 [Brassica cretica]